MERIERIEKIEHHNPIDGNDRIEVDIIINGIQHKITQVDWWENCGETGTTRRCSCGWHDDECEGNGCWQHEHNVAQNWSDPDNIHHQIMENLPNEETMDCVKWNEWNNGNSSCTILVRRRNHEKNYGKNEQC